MAIASRLRTVRPARFDSPEQEAYLSLWRTYDRLRALEDDLFDRYELTPQQYNALRLLRTSHPEPVPTLTLAGRLISRAPDITRLLDRLEERGLVQRNRPAGNRRMVEVAITPAGLALLRQIAGPLRACHGRQLGHMRTGELRQLVKLLRRARGPHEEPGSIWRY
jgi:DNA-binding MarR family transcriptional regulator